MDYCELCSKTFSCERAYQCHLKSKLHQNRINNKDSFFECENCRKLFKQISGLSRHKKNCMMNNNDIHIEKQEMRLQIKNQQTQIEQLTKQITLLLEKGISNTTNSNNNTTNNIETQNVIVVNSFGNENTEYLTDRIITKLIQNGPFTCLPKIIEKIHFDPEHPENHNIKVTNQKTNYAKIIRDNKWVTTNKKKAIDEMIQNGYGILEEKYPDNKDTINDFKQERFEDFQMKFQENDRDLMKTIKDDVDIVVINGTDKLHKP